MNKYQYKPLLLVIMLPLVSSVVVNLSCKKSGLDLRPRGATEETYYSTEAEFKRAVYGAYAKLTDYYGYVNGDGGAGPENIVMPLFFLPGDDLTTNGTNEGFEQFGTLQPSSGRLASFYRTNYHLIARANVLLEKIEEKGAEVYETAGLMDYNRGEAYFLRGFAYYYLWNYFGTSPLVLDRVVSPDQFTPEGTTGTQLLDQAIADFTEAASLLPASWEASEVGRATKNSAYGFLGKCLVFRASATNTAADYTAAISAFNSIAGASLVADYNDNFAYDTENNSESLFEFQASESPGNNIWLNNDFDNFIGNLAIAWNFHDGLEIYTTSRFYATTKLLDAYDADDPRRAIVMDPADRTVTKYVTRDRKSLGWQNSSVNNYRLLRLADVLLLKAEALIQSGGSTAEAIGLINQVRTRARDMVGAGTAPADYSTAETDTQTIMDWIMNERFLELAAEGQRWLDLRRWHMQGIITLDNSFFSSNVATMAFQAPKHLLFPIPNIERDVNPNVTQNAGY